VPGANDGDRFLVEHVMSLRNKLHAACLKLGDTGKLPLGSVMDIFDIVAGHSRQVRLYRRAAKPIGQPSIGYLYTKDIGGGAIELFYENSAGLEVQLTLTGQLKTPLSSKGQLLVHSGTALAALAAGTNDYVLTADSTAPNGVKWAAGAGGGEVGDRFLAVSDATEHAESGTSFVMKKDFQIVFDSGKRPRQWRLVIELWNEGGNGISDQVECQFRCGGETYDEHTFTTLINTEDNIMAYTLDITYDDEPGGGSVFVDSVFTAEFRLKVTSGSSGVAHLRYTDAYLVY
jgi:hypothetical protein